MDDERDRLLAELKALDPTMARRIEDRSPGKPQQKAPALLAAVWVAVMDERWFRSYGKGKRRAEPSVSHACDLLAQRGKTRRGHGGGVNFHFRDGRQPVNLNKASTIRRWFYDAESAAEGGDTFVLSRMRAWLIGARSRMAQAQLEAKYGDKPLSWVRREEIFVPSDD